MKKDAIHKSMCMVINGVKSQIVGTLQELPLQVEGKLRGALMLDIWIPKNLPPI